MDAAKLRELVADAHIAINDAKESLNRMGDMLDAEPTIPTPTDPAPTEPDLPLPEPEPEPSPEPDPDEPPPVVDPDPVPVPPGPVPHIPTPVFSGFTQLSRREFFSKARTESDRIGAEGWDPIEARSGNFSIVVDPLAPADAPGVGQMLYPAGMLAGRAPGNVQINRGRWGGYRPKELYIDLRMMLSNNFYGNQSGTNKMFFCWVMGGARFFVSTEGVGMGPLVPQLRLQGKYILDTRARLLPNVQSSALVQRGRWNRWEFLLRLNDPGVANGSIQWWQDGALISDYNDVGFLNANENGTWEQFQWSPTYGGGGAAVPHAMFLWFDYVQLAGR